MKGGLHLLATSRADRDLYMKQSERFFDIVCDHGQKHAINPYDFLDMLDEMKKVLMQVIAESEVMQ